MIHDGILFSYRDDRSYAESVQRVRQRLCVWADPYYVLTDRRTGNLRRFAVAIFDEKNDADIDVCLLGNTLYILATRLAEHKWFKTKNQPLEFAGCDSSVMQELPFEGGYGALGIIGNVGLPKFTRGQSSMHAAAMKDCMMALARGNASTDQLDRCKIAFAFFAMTIAEAARFTSIETMMYTGGIDPAGVIPLLQSWVIKSSVRDDAFPQREIAVVGVHEQRSGKVWKSLVERLDASPQLAPTNDELAGNSVGTKAFFAKSGVFQNADKGSKHAGGKTGFEQGREFLLDAYFRSRISPDLMDKARAAFDKLQAAGKPVTAPGYQGLKM